MAQSTRVVVVPRELREPLRSRLAAEAFEFRTVPHALFSVKGPEVVATLYSSGKLVVQGSDPDLFVARFLPAGAAPAPTKRASASRACVPDDVVLPGAPVVGSDECGKGDYFGPLVVAAVRLEPAEAAEVARSGVTDSKRLTDERVRVLGAALRGRYPHAIARLDPADYNARYDRPGALNVILAELHARAIRELVQPGDTIVIDQFAASRVMEGALGKLDARLEQRPRAESSSPSVAAASVIAREEFLARLAELSDEVAIDLHKGAGAPVDAAGVRYCDLHGADALDRVAKLHFKNTLKIRSRLR